MSDTSSTPDASALTIGGLLLLVAAGVISVFAFYLPLKDLGAPTPGIDGFLRAYGAVVAGAVAALAALALVPRGGRSAASAMAVVRGAAPWLLAIAVFSFWNSRVSRGDGIGGDIPASTLLMIIAIVAGTLLVWIAAWQGSPQGRGFPFLAAFLVLAAVGEGLVFFWPFREFFSLPVYVYAVGLGVGGLFLLATRDLDRSRLWTWLGWSTVGLLHIWGWGSIWVNISEVYADSDFDAGPRITWTHLVLSSIIPVLVTVAAIVHTQLVRAPAGSVEADDTLVVHDQDAHDQPTQTPEAPSPH